MPLNPAFDGLNCTDATLQTFPTGRPVEEYWFAKVGLMTCTGTWTAGSPPRITDAIFTEPHKVIPAKKAHSPIGVPPVVADGRETVRVEEKIRTPSAPVSTSMSGMTW